VQLPIKCVKLLTLGDRWLYPLCLVQDEELQQDEDLQGSGVNFINILRVAFLNGKVFKLFSFLHFVVL